MYLNYIFNNVNKYTQYNKASLRLPNNEITWQSHMRFDVEYNDTLDIKVCASEGNFNNIIDSYKSSFIYIYYIDYLGLPVTQTSPLK